MHRILLVTAFWFATPAWADDLVRAQELYENGARLYDEGLYEEAIAAFEAAYTLSKLPELYYNIANAYERLAKWQEALDALNKYRAFAPTDERETLDRRMRNLERRINEMLATAPPPPLLVAPPVALLLAAPAALLLGAGRAEAILTYNIFESGADVVVQTSGSLNLPSPSGSGRCRFSGLIVSSVAAVCTGGTGSINIGLPLYLISGPTSFNGTVVVRPASSVSGIYAALFGSNQGFYIGPGYTNSTPIVSSATFNNQTLAGLGFTISSGPIGTWTLNGTGDTINVVLGPPATAVPGPLPLFGAAAAFGWSRKLRRRLASATPTTVG